MAIEMEGSGNSTWINKFHILITILSDVLTLSGATGTILFSLDILNRLYKPQN